MYTVVLYIHIVFLVLYLLVLITKLYYLWTSQDETLLLFSERAKILNLFVLGMVVLTGLYLGFEYDFSDGIWFTSKLILLGAAAFIGDFAFKNYNKWAGLGLIIILVYIIALSYTKSLDLIPHHYPD